MRIVISYSSIFSQELEDSVDISYIPYLYSIATDSALQSGGLLERVQLEYTIFLFCMHEI